MSAAAVSYDMMMPLTLTSAEEHLVAAEAERVLRETFAASAAFVANNRKLPRGEWRHLKTRENVHVYRTTSNGSLSFTVSSSGQTREQEEVELSKPDDLPYVVAFGTFPGTVEDAAFGVIAHTETLTRQRDALMDDKYDAVKILATIQHPTPQDPFSSLTIKWSMKGIGALSRARDCVYVEAVGVTTDANGAQVAYYVMHSIDNIIPRVVGLRHLDIVRVDISTCSMCRPHNDDSQLELFCHGYVNTGGMFAESKGDQLFPETLLSAIHVIECAYVKKLVWLVRTKQLGQDSEVTSSKSSQSSSEASSSLSHDNSSIYLQHSSSGEGGGGGGGSKSCSNCSASLSTLRNLLRSSSSCFACHQEICRKCSVEKRIPAEASDSGFKLKHRMFCLRCLLEAKQAPTREVAGAMLELMP